jgi:hypothetical protein
MPRMLMLVHLNWPQARRLASGRRTGALLPIGVPSSTLLICRSRRI